MIARASMRATTRALLAVLLVGDGRAAAQATQSVTYAEALREASERAPQVIQSAARIDVARADVGVAGNVAPNARLSVGTTARGARVTGSFYVFLPFFGRREASRDAAEAQLDVATDDVAIARLDARLAVSLAWIDLWLAEQEAWVAEEASTRRARLAVIADDELEAGAVSRLDALRARTEAARSSAEASALREQRAGAAARLARWLGRDPGDVELETAGELPTFDSVATAASLIAGLDAHPVIVRVAAAEEASRATVRWQRRALFPIVGLQIGTNLAQRNGAPNEYSGALLLDLPVFSGPQLRRARALEAAAGVDGDAITAAIAVDVTDSRARLVAAGIRARAAIDQVLPVAREAAELAANAYAAGDLDLTTTLSAEQALLEVRFAAERALAEQARAVAMLNHALGRDP
jgi:cobalt-zinc-cadmium efflux system outer membrane protein